MSASPKPRGLRAALPFTLSLLLIPLTQGCTLIAIDSADGPPGVRSDGLIDGHVAFGIRDDDKVLHLDLFDGTSPGAIGELTLWKLARVEVGLAGAAIGLGPVDLALGCLFYDPCIPAMGGDDDEEEEHEHDHDADHSGDHD